MRISSALTLMGAALMSAATAGAGEPARSGSTIIEAACQVFAGRPDCDTVLVEDAANCVIKVLPASPPQLDPASAACLTDEVGTAKVALGKLAAQTPVAGGGQLRIAGRDAFQVMTGTGGYGEALWETRSLQAFPLKGDAAEARQALHELRRMSAEVCTGGPDGRTAGLGQGTEMTAKAAFNAAQAGDRVLVDIRHPEEWKATGIGANGLAVSMHQKMPDFVAQLASAVGGKATPIALICAEGLRSTYLQQALSLYGFTDVANVKEGMTGGRAGDGWIKAGLPVRPYQPQQAAAPATH
ncbi:MAG: rhodanese-like domain-containing protein [Rhodospirillaceae bacterium]